mgnify:FL=1
MEKITEWVKTLDAKVRKPNKIQQNDLFERINSALKEGTDTVEECVAALWLFDAKTIELFYREHYWKYPESLRAEWDQAIICCAEKNKKQTVRATIRIVPIIQAKLPKITSINEILLELRWLSSNANDRSASEFMKLRKNSTLPDLQKLLSLDMNGWPNGKEQIFKMYSIIFSDCEEKNTQKLYSEFLARNENNQSLKKEQNAADETEKTEQNGEENLLLPQSAVDSESGALSSEKTMCKESECENKQDEVSATAAEENDIHQSQGGKLSDGVALAEALLAWTSEQKKKMQSQAEQIAELTYELKKKQTVLENQAAQIAELKERTEKLLAIRINLESVIETAKSENENLKAAKEKAENTIAQVQQMAGNSAKQELEGFKAKLSSEMSYAIKCYQDGCAEDEKAEIYGALLEEMIDVLASNGISAEE